MNSEEGAKHSPPIDRVGLLTEKEGEDTRDLEASINEEGDLAIAGQDLGPKVRDFFQTDEYEYFYTIPADYKDTMLLRLLEDFHAGFPFDDWLKARGIPYKFFNWYSPDEG